MQGGFIDWLLVLLAPPGFEEFSDSFQGVLVFRFESEKSTLAADFISL